MTGTGDDAPLSSLLERGIELSEIAAAFRAVSDGDGRFVVVAGRAGIGKSSLLIEGQRAARAAGFTVLTACAAGIAGVGTALGPVVGGLLASSIGWRWVFLINVPVAAYALWACRSLPNTRDDRGARRQRKPQVTIPPNGPPHLGVQCASRTQVTVVDRNQAILPSR